MSAFGGKADLGRTVLNVRYDPKRTLSGLFRRDPSGRAVPDALKGYRALCNAMTPAKSMHAIKRPMTDVIESVHDVVPTHKNLPRERPF